MSERKNRIRYDYELLQKYCSENGIELRTDYSKVNLNRDTRIKETCLHCDEKSDKIFRSFIDSGCYCKKHTLENQTKKYDATIMERYGVKNISQYEPIKDKKIKTCLKNHGFENPSQSEEIKNKKIKTCFKNNGVEHPMQSEEVREKSKAANLKIRGVEHPLQCQPVKDKMKATNLKIHGVENPLQCQPVKDKMKATNLKIRGVEYASQSKEVKDKKIATNLKTRGVGYPLQCQPVKDKMKATNLKTRGVEYASQSKEVKDKMKATNLKIRGVENPSQCQPVKDKKIATCFKNNGVENPMHNAEISEKCLKNSLKGYDYTFPSGRIERLQGYEKFLMNDLLFKENISEDDIIVKRTDVPEAHYYDKEGKKHRYYVDCLIKSQKRCIEVKSTWTARPSNKEIIYLKHQSLKDIGFKCEIWIYDEKGEIIEKIY